MFARILVGTDGSDSASKAVEHAAGLAKTTGAELLVMSAYEMPRTDPGGPFGAGEAYPALEIGKSILADAEKRLSGGTAVRTILREGPAAEAIIEVAEEEKVDMVVVGNKGMTGAKRFLLGSVPNHVAHHAPCSVLIVHTT
jgi:nucleotide-binding universal stress UspA family protein